VKVLKIIVIRFTMLSNKQCLNWSEFIINDKLTINIYALKGEDGTVLYIGKTGHPRPRLAAHKRANDKSCGSSNIPDDIRKSMTMEILEKCSEEKGTERETYWYKHFKPQYNKMILGGAPTTKTNRQRYLDKYYNGIEPSPEFLRQRLRQRYLNRYHNGVEPPPKPEPKFICECGKTFSVELKEWNLKQHRETSPQHLAWEKTLAFK